jgi:phosphopantothenoylcysteine decarboxylase/phosphopantothenate--cysteine ligase
VVGNDVTRPGSGFGTITNRVTLVTPDGAVRRLPLMSKLAVARRIVTFAERIASDG